LIDRLVRGTALGRRALELAAKRRIRAARGAAKLHLGCGERIFDDYVNVDFPPSAHPLQQTSRADFYADIRRLDFPDASLAEVRSHHVFEHFDRPTALALLARWQRWLTPDGSVWIETPDFDGSARVVLDEARSFRDKAVNLRHLFGSHEASWAYHLEGWSEERFRHTLTRLGYADVTIELHTYKAIHNVTARARRGQVPSLAAQRANVAELLTESLVDASDSELEMHAIWMRAYDELMTSSS
jgi:SAM-dependent methyltransferase